MEKNFKVVKIIDDINIVVNMGSRDSIDLEDILEIYIEGTPVIDPYSKEELGTLDIVKAQLEIVTLYEKMALCQNLKSTSAISLMASGISNSLSQTKPLPLSVDMTQASGGLSVEDTTIKLGDLVRLATT